MKKDKPKEKAADWIRARISPLQKTRYVKAAQARGMTLTDFMFTAMDEKIARGK